MTLEPLANDPAPKPIETAPTVTLSEDGADTVFSALCACEDEAKDAVFTLCRLKDAIRLTHGLPPWQSDENLPPEIRQLLGELEGSLDRIAQEGDYGSRIIARARR